MPAADAEGNLPRLVEEAERILTICNACRYCEGHCAVFPAVERRQSFQVKDLDFLSQLCHQCGACYSHCQYAQPHEFAVNVPRTLSEIRLSGYRRFTNPGFVGWGFNLGLIGTLFAVVVAALCFAVLIAWRGGPSMLISRPDGGFYDVLSHAQMVAVFGLAACLVLLSWGVSFAGYWRQVGLPRPWRIPRSVWRGALVSALTLRNLDGGHGDGCYDTGESPSPWRRRWHHVVFAGFMLCFAATLSGTVKHYLMGLPAPYDWLSLPKLLGVPGGLLLLAGCSGLLVLRRQKVAAIVTDEHATGLSLLWLLLLTSASGLALPLLAGSAFMPVMLCLHLGVVVVLFVNFAGGKFVHGFYRCFALLQDQLEKNDEGPVGSGR